MQRPDVFKPWVASYQRVLEKGAARMSEEERLRRLAALKGDIVNQNFITVLSPTCGANVCLNFAQVVFIRREEAGVYLQLSSGNGMTFTGDFAELLLEAAGL